MPRRPDSDTRHHFRTFEDENHAQKRAFCLHCQKDVCADNIQRMKNHLLKCEVYRNGQSAERIYQLQVENPVAPDAPMTGIGESQPAPPPPAGAVGPGPDLRTTAPPPAPTQEIDLSSTPSMQPTTTPRSNSITGTPVSVAKEKAMSNAVNTVRMAMARSTTRLTDLENVLKTQVQDNMHNAATHVRAAIRDEKDRLFKLAQTLVAQETKLRETQNILRGV